MARFLIPAAIVLVGLTLYALFDALFTPRHVVRSLPKPAWVAVVLLLPLVGPLLWIFLGRARSAGARPAPRPASPDDDEAFLRTLAEQRRRAEREKELARRETELRAREEELRRRDDVEAPDPEAPGSGPADPDAGR